MSAAGTVNRTVKAIRNAHKLKETARVLERERKFAERPSVTPLTREQRVRNYANGRGWTADFTPAQRRRLDHKNNRAMGNHNPYITKVDGAKSFTTTDGIER